MNFADWTEITFVNGTTPAINAAALNSIEESLTGVMNELNYSQGFNFKQYLKYGIENGVKDIKPFDNYIEWTVHNIASRSNEYDNVLLNGVGIKLEDDNTNSGAIGISDTFTSVDCTVFPSGAPSATTDYILLLFYISDVTKFTFVSVRIGTDSSNYYYYEPSFGAGWNFKIHPKSSFGTTGSPSGWDDITFVQIYVWTTTNALGEYFIFNALKLIRANNTDYTLNPFYLNDGTASPPVAADYNIERHITSTCDTIAYYDKKIHKPGILYGYDEPYGSFEILCTVNSFSFRAEIYAKSDDDVCSLRWYIDSSNYLRVDIYDSDLYIHEVVSGVSTDVVITALDDYILKGDRMELWADKTPDNIIRARLAVDGQAPKYAEWETSFSATAAGCVSIVTRSVDSYYFLTDFVVAHNQNSLPPFMGNGITLYKKKTISQLIASSTTFEDDDELWLNLPSNCMMEITLRLAVTGDAAGDIKTQWTTDGTLVQKSYKQCSGASASIANGDGDDATMRVSCHNLGTPVQYGCENTRTLWIVETVVIYTGEEGGKLQLQWAQYTSNATSTIVTSYSYIYAKELK